MSITNNENVGQSGERIARHLLQQALGSNVPAVHPDRGLDSLLEFISPAPGRNRLYVGVQIKTGFSFVEERDHQWKIKIKRQKFERWKRAGVPVLFVWVHPTLVNSAYWHLVTRDTSRDYFFISKRRLVTPTTRYDLAMKLEEWEVPAQSQPAELLIPPLSSGLRPVAKLLYRDFQNQPPPTNPLLGPVRFSWHGWRHMTSQRRPGRDIFHSLQLLPVLRTALEAPLPHPVLRRIDCPTVGAWVFDTRLVTFRLHLEIKNRSEARIECTVRETIKYHRDWMSRPSAAVSRSAVFESIYEKAKKWPQA